MKKSICVLFAVLLAISLCACSGSQSDKQSANNQKNVQDILNEVTDSKEDKTSSSVSQPDVNSITLESGTENVDVDLTALSSTMIYSEVYNMMVTPDDYMGKKIKMKGNFSVYQDTSNGNMYYACVIADATACCSQGLEFTLSGNYSYPQDYPELGTEITVIGEFETYEENGLKYCRLIHAKMV